MEREREIERERASCLYTGMLKKKYRRCLSITSVGIRFLVRFVSPQAWHLYSGTYSTIQCNQKGERENIVLYNLYNLHNILAKVTCASVQISFVNPTIYIESSKQTPSEITEIKVRLLENDRS